ncbi:MAG: metalloregulator ArsR/SmtB family transcription factor [Candidatus Bathyarchaeota archaeon]|nr:metalloregulator ArsR/SmtB family transcription factor [Candidatus Bathyarchaeota archaeon]
MNQKVNEKLKQPAESETCSLEKATEHANDLKVFVDKEMSREDAEVKSKFFKALADPTRLRILTLLTMREICVCEVMAALELTQPTASHHLGILENAGLVKKRKEGKWVFYKLADPEKFEFIRSIVV